MVILKPTWLPKKMKFHHLFPPSFPLLLLLLSLFLFTMSGIEEAKKKAAHMAVDEFVTSNMVRSQKNERIQQGTNTLSFPFHFLPL